MATTTTTSDAEVHSESLNFKTWVLKVSIHCVGCKKKVKKLLNSVPGVSTIDIDAKQHRVVVTGNVEGDALLKKLFKSGKHAELVLPEENHPETPVPNTLSENGNSSKDIPHTKDVKQPPLDTIKTTHIAGGGGGAGAGGGGAGGGSGNSVKITEGVSTGASSSSGGNKATAAADKSIKLDKLTEEPKVEEKKPETDKSSNQTSPPVVDVKDGQTEKNGGGGGGGGSGTVGKKKKKKGQNSNYAVAESSSAKSPNHGGGPPPPAVSSSNDSPPRHYGYSYPTQGPPPSHYYAPPPAPVYGVSYNTAQPSSSYTASYYATPPPQSYAYAYPSEEMGPTRAPPPSDYDAYPRQQLDSFEMFSDENPNGCSVM